MKRTFSFTLFSQSILKSCDLLHLEICTIICQALGGQHRFGNEWPLVHVLLCCYIHKNTWQRFLISYRLLHIAGKWKKKSTTNQTDRKKKREDITARVNKKRKEENSLSKAESRNYLCSCPCGRKLTSERSLFKAWSQRHGRKSYKMTGSEGCGEEVSLELRLQRVWSPEAREEGREREKERMMETEVEI